MLKCNKLSPLGKSVEQSTDNNNTDTDDNNDKTDNRQFIIKG